MLNYHIPMGSFEDGKTFAELDVFTQGYIEAMFFTADDGLEEASFSDLAPETLARIKSDCTDFQAGLPRDMWGRSALDLAYDSSPREYSEIDAGQDFWFTRNHHGVGYWDRGLGAIADELTDAAHTMGEVSLCMGDDGTLYLE